MAAWVVCASCQLAHSLRSDHLCPRCGAIVASAAPSPARPQAPAASPRPPTTSQPPTGLPDSRGTPGVCQSCGTAGPTQYVEFKQNVGVIVLRFHRTLKGQLCARCVSEQFRGMTLITLVAGWWGIISFFLTPIVLVGNLVQYLGARSAFRSGRPDSIGSGRVAPAVGPGTTDRRRKGLAVASLALGLLGTLCLGLGGIVPLVAIALGVVALYNVSRSPEQYGGRGLALGGIAAGGAGLAIALVSWALALLAVTNDRNRTPAQRDFEAASRTIDAYSGQEAFGNTPEAQAMAQRFSRVMKAAERVAFTGKDDKAVSLSEGRFLTHVELRQDGVCFLVHVPQLRNYDGEVRRALLDIAWMAAKEATRDVRRDRDLQLAVGLRGALAYGAVAIGMGEGKPTQELASVVSTTPLHAFFAGPGRPSASQPK